MTDQNWYVVKRLWCRGCKTGRRMRVDEQAGDLCCTKCGRHRGLRMRRLRPGEHATRAAKSPGMPDRMRILVEYIEVNFTV